MTMTTEERGLLENRARVLPRRLVVGLLGLLTAGAVLFGAASPAHAWYRGNAYLVIGNWNCVGGGSVTAVYGAVDNIWSGGDAGDNIIWPTVRVGDTNTFNGRAYCSRPWYRGGPYWVNIVWKQFRPTASNQTFWF